MMRTVAAGLISLQCWTLTAWASSALVYKTIHYPGARHTFASSIDDGIIVGSFSNSASTYPYHGFIYDGNTYTTIDYPGSVSTVLPDIDENRIVGHYDRDGRRHGFVYEASMFTTLDHPLTSSRFFNGSAAMGVSGDRMVGLYMDDAMRTHGYTFDGSSFTTIDHPLAGSFTSATGIDGNYIVGTYTGGGGHYGYLYNGNAFLTIDHPLGANSTLALDVSGKRVVGYYVDSGFAAHGYIFDGANYATLAVPSSIGRETLANGIDGNTVVGQYLANDGGYRGFVTIPEPAGIGSLLLLGISLMAIPRLVSRRGPIPILLANYGRAARANVRSWSW